MYLQICASILHTLNQMLPMYSSIHYFPVSFGQCCIGDTHIISAQQVHILGASLGAFLAQKVAELTYKSPRVHSLLLCNGFVDTTAFKQTKTAKAWVHVCPSAMYKC